MKKQAGEVTQDPNEEVDDVEQVEVDEEVEETDEAEETDGEEEPDEEEAEEADDESEEAEGDESEEDDAERDQELGKRAQKRIGKLTGKVKDLERRLEEAQKLSGDDGAAVLAAAETAGVLPSLLSTEDAKGLKALDAKVAALSFVKQQLRTDNDEFDIGGKTYTRRQLEGEREDLADEVADLKAKYGSKRTELQKQTREIIELGLKAKKAGWTGEASKRKPAKPVKKQLNDKPSPGNRRPTRSGGEIKYEDVEDSDGLEAMIRQQLRRKKK